MLELAVYHAERCTDDRKRFRLGAVGIRNDGVVVHARNSAAVLPSPNAHAEARLAPKLTPGSVVFVARVLRRDGALAMAKPCPHCLARLRAAGVAKVYFTTDNGAVDSLCLQG